MTRRALVLSVLLAGCSQKAAPTVPEAPPTVAPAPVVKPKAPLAELRVKATEAGESCMYWFGEEPYSEERAAEIKQGIAKACPEALKTLQGLWDETGKDGQIAAGIIDVLSLVPPEYAEPVFPAATTPGLCDAARTFHATSDADESYFTTFCAKK